MNNDLEQFSEERLKQLASGKYAGTGLGIQNREVAPLARIALAAKQAKPVAYTDNLSLETLQGNGMACMWKEGNGAEWREQIPIYTTPQPAHTEQDGWSSNGDVNSALVMLDRIETTDPADDDRIDDIKRIIRQLTTTPANPLELPDGWVSIPKDMLADYRDVKNGEVQAYKASFGSHCDIPRSRWQRDLADLTEELAEIDKLIAAPKPESE